ncbi:MAG: peroxiredoxin [Candidatus Binataceae bacterium]
MRLLPPAVLVVAVAGALLFILLRPRSAQAAPLSVGAPAPDFIAQAITAGQAIPVHLSDYRGRQVVLYFYPKDNTPGCSREACAFRDGYAIFQQAGITVLGCSIDSADAHARFIKKYGLPFPLLLDPDHKIAKVYHADNGIPILGLDKRLTYVIGADGTIEKVYPEVDPATNAREIIHDLGADRPHPAVTTSPAPPIGSAEAPPQPAGIRRAPAKPATPDGSGNNDIE